MIAYRQLFSSVFAALLFWVVAWSNVYSEANRKSIPRAKIKNKRPTFFLISVGVNQFKDDFFPGLKFAETDAKLVAKKFGTETNYQIERYVLLGDEASLLSIKKVMADVARVASPQDMVGFYFSGHGTLTRLENGRIAKIGVLSDTRKNNLISTGLSHQFVKNWLDSLRSKRRFAIIASCHSGEGKSRISESLKDFINEKKGSSQQLESVSEGVVFASAASFGETAHESKKLRGDIYTHFLIKGLSQGDRNADGMVTLREAHDYSRAKTFRYSGGLQRPTIAVSEIGKADLGLFGKPKEPGLPVLEGYSASLTGLSLGLAGKGGRRALPGALVLEQGISEVEVIGGSDKVIARYRVRLKQGETLQLSQLLAGPKFFITPIVGFEKALSLKMKKLTNNKNSLFIGVRADIRLLPFLRVGMKYDAPTVAHKANIDLGLTAALSHSEVGFYGLVDWSSAQMINYFAEFELSRSSWHLKLADDQSIYKETRESQAMRWSLGAGLGVDVGANNRVFTALKYSSAQHKFGSWGDVDAATSQIHLGLEIGLGAKGTQL